MEMADRQRHGRMIAVSGSKSIHCSSPNASARAAGVSHLVQFIQGDLFTADLSAATVVALYLSPSLNERIKPRLQTVLDRQHKLRI
jgi:hypothetical protein